MHTFLRAEPAGYRYICLCTPLKIEQTRHFTAGNSG